MLARGWVHRLAPLAEAGSKAKLLGMRAETVGDRGGTEGQ
jgi:hypothetical protein